MSFRGVSNVGSSRPSLFDGCARRRRAERRARAARASAARSRPENDLFRDIALAAETATFWSSSDHRDGPWSANHCTPADHCSLVSKSLHSRKINARSSEFEPKYLRTSIALWVDGGSQETQYSVLSTCYSVHSVFSSWYSGLNTQEHCLAAVLCVVACCCCCCLFDHLWGLHFPSVIGSSWAQHRGSHHANRANEVDTRNIMRQVNLHRAAHREQTAKPYSSRDGT